MISVATVAAKALESARAAVVKARAHLDECEEYVKECEMQVQLVNQLTKECANLMKKLAGPCPPVDNAPDHVYITRVDLGGGKNSQNCGRHYSVVSPVSNM
jgi:hypothetical protein